MRTKLIFALFLAAACEGPAGPAGRNGENGTSGANGTGADGGANGAPGRNSYLTDQGLVVTVTGAQIANGVANVAFTLTDGKGTPLDAAGKYTEGAIQLRFVIAWLDADAMGNPGVYTAYTTHAHTSSISQKTETQANADEGGSLAEIGAGNGTYVYTFGTKVNVADPAKTHTIGIWGWRNFSGKRWVSNVTYDFLPNGAAVTVRREVTPTKACNQCHNPMSHHEYDSARRETSLCILCHTPQSKDPTSGESLDARAMFHRMHRGSSLPSVIAKTPMVLYDEMDQPDDFSTVVFPQEINNCTQCHQGGAQSDNWKNKPGRVACGSCHDDISFVDPPPQGKILHKGGVMTDDTKCSVCHPAQGGLEGITDVHYRGLLDPNAPAYTVQIGGIDNSGPGQTPIVHFTVKKNGQAFDILQSPLTRLAVTLAGPTTDYANNQPVQFTVQGAGASGQLAAENGGFKYTLPSPISMSASGSIAFGMEGYAQDPKDATLRYATQNPVFYAAVTDAQPAARRTVVDRTLCNSCHRDLSAHGGLRKNPEYCVLCHTPNKVNDQRAPRFQVASTVVPSVDLKVLVHRIHMGEDLTQPYVVGGFPAPTQQNPGGTPISFNDVRFPGNKRACWACHKGTSYTLPLADGLIPTKTSQTLTCLDPTPWNSNAWCASRQVVSETFAGPTAAACTACHDAPATAAHAQIMTAQNGAESCSVCHGAGKQWDVQAVHALAP